MRWRHEIMMKCCKNCHMCSNEELKQFIYSSETVVFKRLKTNKYELKNILKNVDFEVITSIFLNVLF